MINYLWHIYLTFPFFSLFLCIGMPLFHSFSYTCLFHPSIFLHLHETKYRKFQSSAIGITQTFIDMAVIRWGYSPDVYLWNRLSLGTFPSTKSVSYFLNVSECFPSFIALAQPLFALSGGHLTGHCAHVNHCGWSILSWFTTLYQSHTLYSI